MAHRIRETMTDHDPDPLGGRDKVVEANEFLIAKPREIFVNGKGWQQARGYATKRTITASDNEGLIDASLRLFVGEDS